MSVFQVISFDGNVRPHIVPTAMSQRLVDEIFERFGANVQLFRNIQVGQEVCFDMGGVLTRLNGWVTIEVDGVKLSTLIRDVKFLHGKLEALESRDMWGTVYYKLHTKKHSLIVTPAQRDILLAAWSSPNIDILVKKEAEALDRWIDEGVAKKLDAVG